MIFGFKSDIGKLRENNEDSLFADEQLGIFIVADGMGGHQGGEVASKMAVDILSASIKDVMENSGVDLRHTIREAIHKANASIYDRGQRDKDLTGMGTTMVLAVFRGDDVYIAHVGDSRAYQVKAETIRQITSDHSLAACHVRAGEMTAEEARVSSLRHILTMALGSGGLIEPEMSTVKLMDGDYILLCTDGLTDEMTDEEIKGIVGSSNTPQIICDALVDTANKKGGRDNITVLIVKRQS